MSIKIRLLLLVCLITILPSAGLGTMVYFISKSSLDERIRSAFGDRLELAKLKLEGALGELSKNAEAWTTAPAMSDIKIADSDMRIASFLITTKKAYPIVKDLTVFDARGKIVGTTNINLMDDGSDEAKSKTVTSEALISFGIEATLKNVILSDIAAGDQPSFISLPVHDIVTKDGTVVGVLTIEINRAKLDEMVKGSNKDKGVQERTNLYLTRSGKEITSLTETDLKVSVDELSTVDGIWAPGFKKQEVGSKIYVMSSTPLEKALPNLKEPLTLTVLQSEGMVYESVRRLAIFVIFLSIGFVVVFIGAGAKFANTLSHPIQKLKSVAEDIIKSQDLSKRVEDQGQDEIGALGRSFNQLLEEVQKSRAKLEEYSKGLEIKVSERTKAIRTILDHVTFGLVVVDPNMRVCEGYSHSCLTLLDCQGQDLVGQSLLNLLGISAREGKNFKLIYDQIFDDQFQLGDLSADQLPSRLRIGSRVIGLTGSVIHDDAGRSVGVLFCLSDISRLVEAEEEVTVNRSLLRMLSNRDGLRNFLDDVKERFERIKGILHEPSPKLDESQARLDLHTLKGNFGIYGLEEIAHKIHVIEEATNLMLKDIQETEVVFSEFMRVHEDVLGIKYVGEQAETFIVPDSIVRQAEKDLYATNDPFQRAEIMNEFISRIRMKLVRTMLGPIDDGFNQLAHRLGKAVKLIVNGRDLLMPGEFSPLFQNIVHMVRNSLDHGIEPPHERNPKPEVATVTLSFKETPVDWQIILEDDGRGINLRAVTKKALSLALVTPEQLAAMSDEEKAKLIFHSGLSTASEVSDISGRGVGMGAIEEAVTALNGLIGIETHEGIGTKFTIYTPKLCNIKQPLALSIA